MKKRKFKYVANARKNGSRVPSSPFQRNWLRIALKTTWLKDLWVMW
jgi:hypothetical protein